MQVYEVLLGCALGIALAVLGYNLAYKLKKFLYKHRQKKQRQRIVQDVLHAALAQRSNVRLEVMQGDFKGFSAEGIFNAVAGEHMILQVTDAFGAHQWVDVPLILFLSVKQKGKSSFFHFTTHAFTAVRKGSFTELHMHLPQEISPGQKRAFLRYTPPKTDVYGMGLWLTTGNTPMPTSRDALDKPFLVFRPKAQNDMVLDNISAGGLRVYIHERVMAEHEHLLSREATVIFLVVLANIKKEHGEKTEPRTESTQDTAQETQSQEAKKAAENVEQEKSSISFWISCRVTMRTHMEKNKLWLLSVRFENWAPVANDSKKITWFPTDRDKSVPPLSTWVMRSHMEQTKKIS